MDFHLLSAKVIANIVLYFQWEIAFRDKDKWNGIFRQTETGEALYPEPPPERGWAFLTWVSHEGVFRDQPGLKWGRMIWFGSDWAPQLWKLDLAIDGRPQLFLIKDAPKDSLSVLTACWSDSHWLNKAGVQERRWYVFYSLFSALPHHQISGCCWLQR